MSLTPKQHRLLSFINPIVKTWAMLSQAEIAKHFVFALGTVQNYLKALEGKGYLARRKNLSRSLQLMEIHPNAVRIPLAGRVAAGAPIEAIEQQETVDVPPSLIRGGTNFALEVKGESMIDEGIHNGDLVIVRKQSSAENGQIVVAMLDGEATVKTFHRSRKGIELVPANIAMQPIRVESGQGFQILGIVVGLIRKYE
jgi:repressor LexA